MVAGGKKEERTAVCISTARDGGLLLPFLLLLVLRCGEEESETVNITRMVIC